MGWLVDLLLVKSVIFHVFKHCFALNQMHCNSELSGLVQGFFIEKINAEKNNYELKVTDQTMWRDRSLYSLQFKLYVCQSYFRLQ